MNKKILLVLAAISTVVLAKNRIEFVDQNNLGLTKEMVEQDKYNAEQQRIKGYYDKESDYPKFLMTAKLRANHEIRSFAGKDATDTHFKASLKEIKLAWDYKGISKDVIGYAAIGGYTDKGWTGVKQIFEEKVIGICEYSITNMDLTDGKVSTTKESARYDINNKLSSIEVSGNKHQGFSYQVWWYDNKFAHELECANQKFDRKITEKVIQLAKDIDNN